MTKWLWVPCVVRIVWTTCSKAGPGFHILFGPSHQACLARDLVPHIFSVAFSNLHSYISSSRLPNHQTPTDKKNGRLVHLVVFGRCSIVLGCSFQASPPAATRAAMCWASPRPSTTVAFPGLGSSPRVPRRAGHRWRRGEIRENREEKAFGFPSWSGRTQEVNKNSKELTNPSREGLIIEQSTYANHPPQDFQAL